MAFTFKDARILLNQLLTKGKTNVTQGLAQLASNPGLNRAAQTFSPPNIQQRAAQAASNPMINRVAQGIQNLPTSRVLPMQQYGFNPQQSPWQQLGEDYRYQFNQARQNVPKTLEGLQKPSLIPAYPVLKYLWNNMKLQSPQVSPMQSAQEQQRILGTLPSDAAKRAAFGQGVTNMGLGFLGTAPTAIEKLTPQLARSILKVNPDATVEEIELAARNLQKAEYPRTVIEMANRSKVNAAKLINRAREVLLSEASNRLPYVQKLLAGKENVTQGLMNESLAQTSFRRKLSLTPKEVYTGERVVSNPGTFEKEMIEFNKEQNLKKYFASQARPLETNIQLQTDKAAKQVAETEAAIGTPVKEFQKWVNTRAATKVEGILQSREFEPLRVKGVQGIFDFQSGAKTPEAEFVKSYFDTKWGQMQEMGLNFNYKSDYLPQLWNNTREEVEKVFGRSLSKRPSFTIDALFKNYKEGVEAGLKPKVSNIPDLVRWYEQTSNKAIADFNFFKYLAKENMIQTSSHAPSDWVTLDPDHFPKFSVKIEGGNYAGVYKAPPELAEMINNYLKDPNASLEKIANWASTTKNRLLSFGIPTTAINMHGVNILARSFMQDPISGTYRALKYMFNPNSAARYIDQELEKAPFAIKHGLTFSTSEYKGIFDEADKAFLNKFGEGWNKVFEKPLFDKMIPALKLQKFYEVFEGMKKSLSEEEAAGEAAKFVNNLFGGFNWQQMGKSKDWQNVQRAIILAPDWLNTNARLGGNIVKSLTWKIGSPEMSAYRKFAATFAFGYIALNAINKMLSGHWMFENEPGHQFEIDTNTYSADGKKRYFRIYGTAGDFARLPFETVSDIAQGRLDLVGKIVRNRVSTFLQPILTAMTNTDAFGNPVFGKTKYGQPMTTAQNLAGAWNTVAPAVGFPQFLQTGLNALTGKIGWEQALTTGFELPLRYGGGTKSEVLYGKYKRLKAKDPVAATKMMNLVRSTNPSLYNDVLREREDEQLGTTKLEKTIRTLGVKSGSRAKAVAKILRKYAPGSKERALKIVDLRKKRIITDEIYLQLVALKKQGEL